MIYGGNNSNMKNEEANSEQMSLSKQRKMARQKEIASRKRNAVLSKVIIVVVCLLIVGLVTWLIIADQNKKAKEVVADSNHSAQIDDNGMIKDVKPTDYITPADYKNITANLSEIEYKDEDVEKDIDSVLEKNMVLSDSKEVIAKKDDKVNIDYSGKVDGEEFSGGTAKAQDIVLGSGNLIDTFEDQIAGHCPGDTFDVNVTFPDPYEKDEALSGKAAVFSVTLNGVYVKPEFTDEFVKEKLSEHASTADEYRKYIKDTKYKSNLLTFIQKYVTDNTVLNSKPSAYLKQLKANYKNDEMATCDQMNQLYLTYTGAAAYASFEEYISKSYNMTMEEYDESIEDKVTDGLKFALFCQYVAETEGISATVDDARAEYIKNGGTEENFESVLTNYGKGYIVQDALFTKVLEKISESVTVK
jgi:trigger factor